MSCDLEFHITTAGDAGKHSENRKTGFREFCPPGFEGHSFAFEVGVNLLLAGTGFADDGNLIVYAGDTSDRLRNFTRPTSGLIVRRGAGEQNILTVGLNARPEKILLTHGFRRLCAYLILDVRGLAEYAHEHQA